jgi:N-acetylglucosaminyldiphosphoundecaprenol N-acetyl-beta-D-mannosaminyltransferase
MEIATAGRARPQPEPEHAASGWGLPTVSLMGMDLNAISERQTISYVLDELAEGRGGWMCTVNVEILRRWRRSSEVRGLVAATDLAVADGMPLIWASRLQGTPLPERVAGSTLTLTLSAAAAQAGASVFLLGGNAGVAEEAALQLQRLHPGLRVAGSLCPPPGFERDPGWAVRIERALTAAEPDIVFVGLGFPKQERLIATLRPILPRAWFVGCGIALSFVAGEIPRAPRLLQRLGLEWLHRLHHEPRRLARRYLLDGVPFALEMLSASLLLRLQTEQRGAPASVRLRIDNYPCERRKPPEVR